MMTLAKLGPPHLEIFLPLNSSSFMVETLVDFLESRVRQAVLSSPLNGFGPVNVGNW